MTYSRASHMTCRTFQKLSHSSVRSQALVPGVLLEQYIYLAHLTLETSASTSWSLVDFSFTLVVLSRFGVVAVVCARVLVF